MLSSWGGGPFGDAKGPDEEPVHFSGDGCARTLVQQSARSCLFEPETQVPALRGMHKSFVCFCPAAPDEKRRSG